MSQHTQVVLEITKLAVSICGLAGTFVAAFLAIRTFLRTEKWKRAEFLAREMKEFFAKPQVSNALTLMDWGTRRIKLLNEGQADNGSIVVTRQMQVWALLPHTLPRTPSEPADFGENSNEVRRFDQYEAATRDCYDAFLDGLEAFASYVRTRLIDIEDLRPYLQYWIDDIHSSAKDPDDAAWSAALVTFIAFYRYEGVQWLFDRFDRSIRPGSEAFRSLLTMMTDRELADKLASVFKRDLSLDLSKPFHAGK